MRQLATSTTLQLKLEAVMPGMLLDQRAPSAGFNWRVHILAWIQLVATSGEKLSVSGARCFVCTSDRRDMHTVHNWWLKTGEYACPVFDIIDIFCELPDLQACRVHKLCPESFRNREFVQNFCKLQIQRHGGARGGRWADRKHFKCEMQSLIKLEACARDKCAGRCDVTNTERSPQPCHNPRNLPELLMLLSRGAQSAPENSTSRHSAVAHERGQRRA